MRTLPLCILLAISASASAQDADEDGCIDAYEVGTTCVDVTATVGPDVSFGTDVIIAARASLGGRASHPSNPLPVGDGVIVGRQTTIGVDHILGADTYIGRSATIGANLTTLPNATVGYGAQLGDNVTLGTGAAVGNLVEIGDYASIGDNAVISRSTTIADAANSGQGTVIDGIVGPDTAISADVRVELGARVRKQATLLEGARIESSARVGRGAQIGAGATVHGTVGSHAIIGAGATVGAGAFISRGGELCASQTLPDNTLVGNNQTYPFSGCAGGATSTDPGLTCLDIVTQSPSSASGTYWLDPNGGDPSDSYEAYCDMTTDGGGWMLVHTKVSYTFNPRSNSSFDAACAVSTGSDCASAINPEVTWSEALWRFNDTDDYWVAYDNSQSAVFTTFLNGSGNVAGTSVSGWRRNRPVDGLTTSGTIPALHFRPTYYISEAHSSSDQWIDLWNGVDGTNNYQSVEGTNTRGTKCIAGYCRPNPVWMMVR